jgi:hypothetical protein
MSVIIRPNKYWPKFWTTERNGFVTLTDYREAAPQVTNEVQTEMNKEPKRLLENLIWKGVNTNTNTNANTNTHTQSNTF